MGQNIPTIVRERARGGGGGVEETERAERAEERLAAERESEGARTRLQRGSLHRVQDTVPLDHR